MFPRLEALGATVHKNLPTFPKARGYVWSLMSCFAILRLAIRLKPRIVVADHTNGLWLLLFLKAIRFPSKAIYRNHGVGFLTNRPFLTRLIYRGVDRIITVSQPEADALQRLINRPVDLVPNCLPAHCLTVRPVQEVRKDPQSPRIAYVGWLNRAKGIYDFMNIIAEIRKDLPGAQGIAIGRVALERSSEDSREDLLARMRAAGVDYLGELPRENIFREIDFLLVCSSRESFGLTVLEAPFSGTIPIAYDSPGTHFLLGSVPECLVENGQSEQMKEAVLRLWRDLEARSELCERLRTQFLRQFDPNLLAGRLVAGFVSN
jgi:glycosyltransferase involved in cell wall biosynthesis